MQGQARSANFLIFFSVERHEERATKRGPIARGREREGIGDASEEPGVGPLEFRLPPLLCSCCRRPSLPVRPAHARSPAPARAAVALAGPSSLASARVRRASQRAHLVELFRRVRPAFGFSPSQNPPRCRSAPRSARRCTASRSSSGRSSSAPSVRFAPRERKLWSWLDRVAVAMRRENPRARQHDAGEARRGGGGGGGGGDDGRKWGERARENGGLFRLLKTSRRS